MMAKKMTHLLENSLPQGGAYAMLYQPRYNFLITLILFLALVFAASRGMAGETESDFFMRGHGQGNYDWNKWRSRYDRIPRPGVPKNVTYSEKCQGCHFMFQPWLLPERSWAAIMDNTGKHFGKDLKLGEKDANEIEKYLKSYAADRIKPRNEWVLRILRSVRGITPESIGEIPYIKKKHAGISAKVYKRASIKGFFNCAACHKGALQGNYGDGKIPEGAKQGH